VSQVTFQASQVVVSTTAFYRCRRTGLCSYLWLAVPVMGYLLPSIT